METISQKKSNWWALLPIGVFLVVYIGVSIIFNDFYVMSVVQAIIPYGAQMITATSLTTALAIEIIPYLFYPYLLGLSALLFILIPALNKNN